MERSISVALELAGERLTLLPERAVLWRARATLLIADLHLGKDSVFRTRGIALPRGVGTSDLARLSKVIEAHGIQKLIVLGDLLHGRTGLTPATCDAFMEWRAAHTALAIVLVRGNHDRSAGDPPGEWSIDCVSEPYSEAPLPLVHVPDLLSCSAPTLAGHLHPAVTLTCRANQRLTLPCFLLRDQLLILPSFTEFSGRPQIATELDDRVFVIGDGQVVEIERHM